MIGVQPFQNRPKCPLLRFPQAEPLGRCFLATRLAILDEIAEIDHLVRGRRGQLILVPIRDAAGEFAGRHAQTEMAQTSDSSP